ncbi:MAG: molybdenum cofactor biosynthesis protein MoaE [Burkholderiales bacterium]
MTVRVQSEDFDAGAEIAALRRGDAKIGAVAAFIGLVRDINDDSQIQSMTLEHYPGMTERSLEGIVASAKARFGVEHALVIHRVGELRPTDQIVLVVTAGGHRGKAFSACEFIMDYLKTEAPFWKKEQATEGARWVESRHSDDQARERWNTKPTKLVR